MVEVPEVPKWIRAPLLEDFILTESPSSVYSRAVVKGPTWQVEGAIRVDRPEAYCFEVSMVKYLEHHEGAVQILAGSKTRAYMLEWSPVLVACLEVVEDDPLGPEALQTGSMVWAMVDDLCEQDKIQIWEFMGETMPPYSRDDRG